MNNKDSVKGIVIVLHSLCMQQWLSCAIITWAKMTFPPIMSSIGLKTTVRVTTDNDQPCIMKEFWRYGGLAIWKLDIQIEFWVLHLELL